ncbi:serine/threonine-protein kinase [Nocardia sp. NPDC057668]|uniref:serine/threonine-protein kinase n=1 Tax=Nocardia sp. NPDC057668 TaxID=3346202 RepID=UPI0036700374
MIIGPGATLGGYYLERVLGSGGMGTVYLARHPTLPRFDALKVLWPHLVGDPEYRARFEREANLAAALDHPNIVSVQNRGEDQGCLWIALQYVNGTDAASALEASPGGLEPERALRIVAEIGQGLDHAHRAGLLHRDIKPANFLLAPQQHGDERVLLADFGIAKPSGDATELTRTGTFLATVAYASPEQLSGGPLDSRTDVYSLGASFYRLVTGQPPFPGTQAMTVMTGHLHKPPPRITAARPDLPAALDDVLARVLAKDPGDRFATCLEFTDAAAAALAGRGAPPSFAGPSGESARRSPAPAPFSPRAAETVEQQFAPPPESGVRPFASLVGPSDAWIPHDIRATGPDAERTVVHSGGGAFDQQTDRAVPAGYPSKGVRPNFVWSDSAAQAQDGVPPARAGSKWKAIVIALVCVGVVASIALAISNAVGAEGDSAADDEYATTRTTLSTTTSNGYTTTGPAPIARQEPCSFMTPNMRDRLDVRDKGTLSDTGDQRRCDWQMRNSGGRLSLAVSILVSSRRFPDEPGATVVTIGNSVQARQTALSPGGEPDHMTCTLAWPTTYGYVSVATTGYLSKAGREELCGYAVELADVVYQSVWR